MSTNFHAVRRFCLDIFLSVLSGWFQYAFKNSCKNGGFWVKQSLNKHLHYIYAKCLFFIEGHIHIMPSQVFYAELIYGFKMPISFQNILLVMRYFFTIFYLVFLFLEQCNSKIVYQRLCVKLSIFYTYSQS